MIDCQAARILFYIVPFLPLFSRGALAAEYFDIKNELISKEQRAGDSYRAIILGMAAFSFAGVVGIVALDAARQSELQIPVFYVLVSFLCYLSALNMQEYKFFVSRDILSDALVDVANLSLLCCVMALVFSANYGVLYKGVVVGLGVLAWLPDHLVRLKYTWKDYGTIRTKKAHTAQPDKEVSIR